MNDIRVPKKVVEAPYWDLGEHFLRIDEPQQLSPEFVDYLFASLGVTPFARTLLDDATAAQARGTLGLGTMATQAAGTGAGQFRTNAQIDARYVRFDGAQGLSSAQQGVARSNIGASSSGDLSPIVAELATKLNRDGSNVPDGGFFGLGAGASGRVTNLDTLRGTRLFGLGSATGVPAGGDGLGWQIEDTGQRTQFVIMSQSGIFTRTDDAQPQPGTWGPWYQLGTGHPTNTWAVQPIGVPIPVFTNLSGVSAPPNGSDYYRYIKLTASDSYNSGLLSNESVSGSAPLVQATARIADSASPLNGQTVRLINTERRVLRAGSVGAVENDQMQAITGRLDDVDMANAASGAFTLTAGADRPTGGGNTRRHANFNSANSPGARTGNETRPKNIGVDYYMRIR